MGTRSVVPRSATAHETVWRRWPSWAAPAAGIWSVLFGLTGVHWAVGGSGFPVGPGDPRVGEVGSLFDAAEPTTTGLVMAVLGLAGAVVALVMTRTTRAWPSLVFAAAMSVILLVVVPDLRVVQNFAYLFFGYTGLWDRALLFMLGCMAGGVLWAAAALACLRRSRDACRHCGRDEPGAVVSASTLRWGRWATYTAAALALPYPIVRICWALGIPLGVDWLDGAFTLPERIGLVLLFGGLPVGGAILTLGLLQRWGEVFPRWIPYLRSRRVPIWFAVAPATWAGILLIQAGFRIVVWTASGASPITADTWGSGLPGLSWLPWGLALCVATYAYYLRRRGRCQHCGTGVAASGTGVNKEQTRW